MSPQFGGSSGAQCPTSMSTIHRQIVGLSTAVGSARIVSGSGAQVHPVADTPSPATGSIHVRTFFDSVDPPASSLPTSTASATGTGSLDETVTAILLFSQHVGLLFVWYRDPPACVGAG